MVRHCCEAEEESKREGLASLTIGLEPRSSAPGPTLMVRKTQPLRLSGPCPRSSSVAGDTTVALRC